MQPDDTVFEPEPASSAEVEAPPERRPFWNYVDLFLVVGLLFAAVVLLLAAVGFSGVDPIVLALPLQLALYAALYLALHLVFALRYRRSVLPSVGWTPSHFHLSVAFAGGIVLAFAVAAVAALLKTPKVPSPMENFMKSPVLLASFCLLAISLAPFFEELFFRGFLQPLFVRSLGKWFGILLTAILFGGLHAPEYSMAWQYALAVSLVGLALGWVRYQSDSIIPSTIMHAAYNSVFVAALLFQKLHPNS